MNKTELQRATQLLRDLEARTHVSAFNGRHTTQWKDFLSAISVATTAPQISILYDRLRDYGTSMMEKSKLSKDWLFWKHNYWMLMTDPKLNIRKSISRLVICMRFLQAEIDPLEFDDLWNSGKKEEWLQESEELVYPPLQIQFHVELLMHADELVKQFGYSSFSDYKTQNSQVISDIKTAADNLESSTEKASIVRTVGGAMKIAGGAGGLAVLFAPISGGFSIAFYLGGVIATKTSKHYQDHHGKQTVIEIHEKILKLSPEIQAVNELLRNVSVEEFLNVQSALSSLTQERSLTLYQSEYTQVQQIGRQAQTFANYVKRINDFLETMQGKNNVSYSNVDEICRNILMICSGINDIYIGFKQIKDGSDLVNLIRKFTATLETYTTAHFSSYDEARESCEEYLAALESPT